MSLMESSKKTAVRLFAAVTIILAGCIPAPHTEQSEKFQEHESYKFEKLGRVEIPTSARSEEAQAAFLRGVAALHSFWYPVALDEFRAATRIEPDFMMGYWGEAMSHNHPVWGDPQEIEAARSVIEKIEFIPEVTGRERAWLRAVQVLYGEGDKSVRDLAYAAAMETIYRDYPDDQEAALFYALALLGTVRPEDPDGEQIRLRAGEIASKAYQEYPNHPGAAHYIIHAYDDPRHAHLALDAAKRYAGIAPDAPHALHMPSHIFLQLGMWSHAAESNEAAWAASNRWVKQHDLPISQRDYHTLHWLMYVYLQQGRYTEAEELLDVMQQSLVEFPRDDFRNLAFGSVTRAQMVSAFAVQTKNWEAVESVMEENKMAQEGNGLADAIPNSLKVYVAVARIPVIFARGMAAAAKGSKDAQKSISELYRIHEQYADKSKSLPAQAATVAKIQELEIEAVLRSSNGEFEEASTLMRKAIMLEDAMPPPSGPPSGIKPTYELFGEILLRADRPTHAAEQFAISLKRHPNRANSLLGSARAAVKNGDKGTATHFYSEFARLWKQADMLPELQEAKRYAQKEKL